MESAVLSDQDRDLVHALQIDGRAPFSRIAAALGVSEQTVARRYKRLRGDGTIRVVGMVAGPRLGYSSWTIRLRCTSDAAASIATALARRSDTFWVHILSGGTEISCYTQPDTTTERDALLLEKLPRTNRVLAMTAHEVLYARVVPGTWRGLVRLDDDRITSLRPLIEQNALPAESTPAPTSAPIRLDTADRALLDVLAADGRATSNELASVSGLSDTKVRRRLDFLRRSGVLTYQLDISPRALGYQAEARLWMSVRPAGLETVINALADHDEVHFAAVTTGPTNVTAWVVCRRREDLYRYLTEKIGALDAVTHLETAPLIRTVKQAGRRLPA